MDSTISLKTSIIVTEQNLENALDYTKKGDIGYSQNHWVKPIRLFQLGMYEKEKIENRKRLQILVSLKKSVFILQ